MTRLIAHVEFALDAIDVRDGVRKLRDLAIVSSSVGFDMIKGEVRPMSAAPGSRGPTPYGPRADSATRGRPGVAELERAPETSHAQQFTLRQVIPVARQFSDGAWIASAEVWEHGVVVRWAQADLKEGPRLLGADWVISDDLGTIYSSRGGGTSRSGAAAHGHVEFEPAPPPAATMLEIRAGAAQDAISLALGLAI